jgi:cytochrome c-type biogenesis protein
MANESISYIVAFTAGFFTYLSPCLLPLIPSFVAYIAGVSTGDLKSGNIRADIRKKTIVHSLLFILGFSVVFILLGLTATYIGKSLFQYQKAIRIAGGVLIIMFGLYLTGLLKLDFLVKERKFKYTTKGASFLGSFLVGVTFAAAWTPCAGPILGSILVLAGTKASTADGAKLLGAYSLGIGAPFFITALVVNSFLGYLNRFKKLIGAINAAGGVFLIIVGVMVATNYFQVIFGRLLGAFAK